MKHFIKTDSDKMSRSGMEFNSQDPGHCQSCTKTADLCVTLWRRGDGIGWRICEKCARELAIQLIRRT